MNTIIVVVHNIDLLAIWRQRDAVTARNVRCASRIEKSRNFRSVKNIPRWNAANLKSIQTHRGHERILLVRINREGAHLLTENGSNLCGNGAIGDVGPHQVILRIAVRVAAYSAHVNVSAVVAHNGVMRGGDATVDRPQDVPAGGVDLVPQRMVVIAFPGGHVESLSVWRYGRAVDSRRERVIPDDCIAGQGIFHQVWSAGQRRGAPLRDV